MTFVYRQLKAAENFFEPNVICSDVQVNTDRFPFGSIYHKPRNFIRIKKTRLFSKLYGWDRGTWNKSEIIVSTKKNL